MNYDKKGISVISVLVIVVILALLASVTTLSINYIVKNTYKNEYVSEYKLVRSATNDYVMRNSGVIDFIEVEFDLSTVDSENLDQFDGETIVDNKIAMYVIDLEKIGVYNATFGIGTTEDDLYLLSKDTLNIYYQKGYEYDDGIYYKEID